jgi:hypothetical protein
MLCLLICYLENGYLSIICSQNNSRYRHSPARERGLARTGPPGQKPRAVGETE